MIETILNRKSVRKYLDKEIEDEKVQTLLKAGMAAPSGKDIRPWELVVVTERSVLSAMAEGLPYAKMLNEAPLAIVVCGDIEKSPYWYLDCSAVTQNILLAAEALGLGAVWTATYPYEERMQVAKEQLALPDKIFSLCVIPIGYPATPYKPREKFDPKKVHYNRW
ncbi:NAD(P)H nitroreductase [Bacteroidia bacterium]|nr:NAD(P)H nitroreductase [Bacteroidia bacterium]